MGLHVVVGAGPVGRAVTAELLANHHQVRVVTRSGSGPDGCELVSADAGDAARMVELTRGADAVYNCANPAYTKWATDWPPIANALLAAAEASGAVLATTGNLYIYGPVTAPMTEQSPMRPSSKKGAIRAKMWQDALDAHRAGRVRALEVRGSDYLGNAPSLFSMLVLPRMLAGKMALVPADLDSLHTWTNPRQMAQTLVAAATDPRGPGHIWHAPSAAPCSIRQVAAEFAALAGVTAKVRPMPGILLTAGGVFDPMVREFKEMHYQFRAPFVLDDTVTREAFGIEATPFAESLRENLAFARAEIDAKA
jgi:nucleoside-diphosphate-sugar epimerase